jgi:hypothetical protein
MEHSVFMVKSYLPSDTDLKEALEDIYRLVEFKLAH